MSTTQCLAKFGVFKKPGDTEREILDLATEFKEALAESHWREYRDTIEFSYEYVPALFPAMVEAQRLGLLIADCEQQIKAENIKQRTRNSKTPLRETLKSLKNQKTAAWGRVKELRKVFYTLQKQFHTARTEFKPPAKDGLWKNVKTLKTREAAYEALLDSLTGDVKRYGQMWVAFDLERRRLGEKYQQLGLHSDIRIEIVDSVEPKLPTTDGPGTVYEYNRPPEIEPVRKLTIQLKGGGKTLAELLAGKESQLRLELVSERVKGRERRVETIYCVRQVIGNSHKPLVLKYEFKCHKEFPRDAIIKRWSLCCDEHGKRYVTPIIDADHSKKTGQGYVAFDLGYREHENGLKVAYLLGDNIHEEIVLPGWLVNRFRSADLMQSEMDLKANVFLSKRGIECQGKNPIKVIEKLAMDPTETAAQNFMDEYRLHESRRVKMWQAAIRARQNIYEHAVECVRRRHSHVILDAIEIKKLQQRKKVDDTGRELPQAVRNNRQIAAIGTLFALFKKSGLVTLEVDVGETSRTCPHCGHVNQPRQNKELRCEECREKWDRDYGACVEMLSRADVPRQKAIHSRKTGIISTYVDSLAIPGVSPRAYKDDLSQGGEYRKAA
jgi:hypothetical protein